MEIYDDSGHEDDYLNNLMPHSLGMGNSLITPCTPPPPAPAPAPAPAPMPVSVPQSNVEQPSVPLRQSGKSPAIYRQIVQKPILPSPVEDDASLELNSSLPSPMQSVPVSVPLPEPRPVPKPSPLKISVTQEVFPHADDPLSPSKEQVVVETTKDKAALSVNQPSDAFASDSELGNFFKSVSSAQLEFDLLCDKILENTDLLKSCFTRRDYSLLLLGWSIFVNSPDDPIPESMKAPENPILPADYIEKYVNQLYLMRTRNWKQVTGQFDKVCKQKGFQRSKRWKQHNLFLKCDEYTCYTKFVIAFVPDGSSINETVLVTEPVDGKTGTYHVLFHVYKSKARGDEESKSKSKSKKRKAPDHDNDHEKPSNKKRKLASSLAKKFVQANDLEEIAKKPIRQKEEEEEEESLISEHVVVEEEEEEEDEDDNISEPETSCSSEQQFLEEYDDGHLNHDQTWLSRTVEATLRTLKPEQLLALLSKIPSVSTVQLGEIIREVYK